MRITIQVFNMLIELNIYNHKPSKLDIVNLLLYNTVHLVNNNNKKKDRLP